MIPNNEAVKQRYLCRSWVLFRNVTCNRKEMPKLSKKFLISSIFKAFLKLVQTCLNLFKLVHHSWNLPLPFCYQARKGIKTTDILRIFFLMKKSREKREWCVFTENITKVLSCEERDLRQQAFWGWAFEIKIRKKKENDMFWSKKSRKKENDGFCRKISRKEI